MCNCKCTECDCCNKQNTPFIDDDKYFEYLKDCDLLGRIENHGVMYSTDLGWNGCERVIGNW